MDKRAETTVTISMVKLNIYALLIIFVLAFGISFLHSLLSGGVQLEFTLPTIFLFMIAMLVLVCIHEAIHLIGFHYIGCVPWSELKWSVNWKLGVAYAHSKQAITVKQMKKVLISGCGFLIPSASETRIVFVYVCMFSARRLFI